MNIPDIEDFGGGVGVADNTPAFNAAVLAGVCVRFRDTSLIGSYRFATEPAVIDKSFAVYGALPGVPAMCAVERDYQPSTPTRGLFHGIHGQLYVQDLMMFAKSGSQGAAVSIVPKVGGNSAQSGLKSIRITTNGGSWNHDIYVNGNNAINPQGVRCLTIMDAVLFGTNQASIHFDNCVHFNIIGGSVNQAGGLNGGIWIGGTAGVPSTTGTICLDYVSNNVGFARASRITADVGFCGGQVVMTGDASDIRGRGVAFGGVSNSGINNVWG